MDHGDVDVWEYQYCMLRSRGEPLCKLIGVTEAIFLAQTTIEDALTGQTGGGQARLTRGDSNVRETRDRIGAPPSGSHLGPHDPQALQPRATRPSLEKQSVPRSVIRLRCVPSINPPSSSPMKQNSP